MSRPRIAIVGNQAFSMVNFRGPLISELTGRGFEVFTFVPDLDEKTRQQLSDLGAVPRTYTLRRNGTNPFSDLAAAFDLYTGLRTASPQIVLSYAAKPSIYGTLAARAAGVPMAFAMIEGLGHIFLAEPTLKSTVLRASVKLMYRVALGLTDKTFFLNADDKNDFVGGGLVAAPKAENIGAIGVDLSVWQPAPPATTPVNFLFVGRLLREKGIMEFAAAARLIKAQYPQVRFTALGDIDSNPSSVSRAEVNAWIQEGLMTLPGQADVAPYMKRASVFVLPSYREGVPRATQEAMAMARPVITTDVPGCRDTVIDGKNGFLVPSGDAPRLADAMERFVRTPELIGEMGKESLSMAQSLFDVRKANARLIEAMNI